MSIETYTDLDLGSSLAEKKLISPNQLKDSISEYRIKGGYLSQHILSLGYIKDADLTTFLTCQYGYCYLPLETYSINDEVLESIPAKIAVDFCVLPIERNDKLLTVSMADPLNKAVIEVLRQVSRCEIVVFISTRAKIKNSIEKYYGISFKDFELDKFKDDITLRDNIKKTTICNGLYAGPNHRRYQRFYGELPGEYHLYPNIIRTKITNMSLSGILFESNVSLPAGTHLAMNIYLENNYFITVILEVVRCDIKNLIESTGSHVAYDVGAFFNFMSEDNQNMLADFLRKKLTA